MSGNTTQLNINITVFEQLDWQNESNIYIFLILSSCVIFLYINGIMLYTLRSKPVFRETPRYILLYNLLFADTYQLALSQFVYILAITRLFLLRYICSIIMSFGILTANVSPLTLAVMSLERYVAVCFPLRHATIVTIRGTGVAIAVVWAICCVNTLIRFITLTILDSIPFEKTMTEFCSVESIFHLKIFTNFSTTFTCIVFVSVGVVIIFSYVGVMVAARSASSNKASTTKARKTVLLHLVQLFLSVSTTLNSPILIAIAESRLDMQKLIRIRTYLYIILIILPRCLTSLIYGLRDKIIRPVLLYHLSLICTPR